MKQVQELDLKTEFKVFLSDEGPFEDHCSFYLVFKVDTPDGESVFNGINFSTGTVQFFPRRLLVHVATNGSLTADAADSWSHRERW